MSRSLIVDPRSERAANSPLEIYSEPGRGPGVYVTDHKYPDPEQEVLSAGGREGKRRSGPPMLGNRQIPIEVFVLGRREDLAAAPINYATNPKGELANKFSPPGGGGWTVTREKENGVLPSYLGEYRDKHAFVAGVDTNAGFMNYTFAATGQWTLSLWVWIPAAWNGGKPRLTIENYAGSATKTTVEADLTRRDQWQRIYTTVEIAGGDLVGNIFVRATVPGSPATGIFYTDCLQIEKGTAPGDYFDGDVPGSSWTGEAHKSTSTQPAAAAQHFEAIVADLEGKLAKLRDEGGTLSRPYQAGRLVFDVEGLTSGEAGGYEGKRWIQRGQRFGTSLECLPYGRGETQTRELRSQTTDPVLVFTETLIPGPVRALGELEIGDAAAVARRGTVAALEVPDYDYTAATAALYYQAESLTPLGSSSLAAVAGATGGGNNTIQTTLEPNWRAIASTKIAASGKHLTHVGVFRIIARVRASGYVENGELQYRLEWGQGDLVERVTNEPARIIARSSAGFYLVDLGLVRIRKAKVGTQRWEGQIIARSYDPAGSNYKPQSNIDDLRIVPVSFAYLRARAASPRLLAPTSYALLDTFSQTKGALNGKSADVGGAWATSNYSGTAVDFEASGAGRVTHIGAGTGTRQALLASILAGSTMGRVALGGAYGTDRGLFLRYTDVNNWVKIASEAGRWCVIKRAAGVFGSLSPYFFVTPGTNPSGSFGMWISSSGFYSLFYSESVDADLVTPIYEGYDPALATGGALASGKAGIFRSESALGGEVWFDNFRVWQPTEPVLIASGRRLRWRHDGVQREDSAGGELWSDIGYEGDPLLVPPSTKEGRVLRAIVFPSRGDLASVADEGNSDDFTARLALTSRHVSVRS